MCFFWHHRDFGHFLSPIMLGNYVYMYVSMFWGWCCLEDLIHSMWQSAGFRYTLPGDGLLAVLRGCCCCGPLRAGDWELIRVVLWVIVVCKSDWNDCLCDFSYISLCLFASFCNSCWYSAVKCINKHFLTKKLNLSKDEVRRWLH